MCTIMIRAPGDPADRDPLRARDSTDPKDELIKQAESPRRRDRRIPALPLAKRTTSYLIDPYRSRPAVRHRRIFTPGSGKGQPIPHVAGRGQPRGGSLQLDSADSTTSPARGGPSSGELPGLRHADHHPFGLAGTSLAPSLTRSRAKCRSTGSWRSSERPDDRPSPRPLTGSAGTPPSSTDPRPRHGALLLARFLIPGRRRPVRSPSWCRSPARLVLHLLERGGDGPHPGRAPRLVPDERLPRLHERGDVAVPGRARPDPTIINPFAGEEYKAFLTTSSGWVVYNPEEADALRRPRLRGRLRLEVRTRLERRQRPPERHDQAPHNVGPRGLHPESAGDRSWGRVRRSDVDQAPPRRACVRPDRRPDGRDGTGVTVTVVGHGLVESAALTFGLAPGALAGAAIDPRTGVITWTPGAAGTYTVGARVTEDDLRGIDRHRGFHRHGRGGDFASFARAITWPRRTQGTRSRSTSPRPNPTPGRRLDLRPRPGDARPVPRLTPRPATSRGRPPRPGSSPSPSASPTTARRPGAPSRTTRSRSTTSPRP